MKLQSLAGRRALWIAFLLVVSVVLAVALWHTTLGCQPAPPPGWAHYPQWLQFQLEMRCNA